MQTEEERAKKAACNKAYYKANKEKIAAQKRAYYRGNKEAILSYKKAYYQANREDILSYKKSYRRDNLEKFKEKDRAYYDLNKEKVLERGKRYAKANPEAGAKGRRKYRAAKRALYVPRSEYWEGVEVRLMEERSRLKAATGFTYHIDHIYPISKGGIDHPSNYQLLSPEDNLRKGTSVGSDCPRQMRMKEVSELVGLGVDIDEALQLTRSKTYKTK